MAVLKAYSHKRGDSFSMASQWPMQPGATPDDPPVPTDLTGWTGRAQVRDTKGRLVQELVFTWVDQVRGMFRVEALDTDHWPVGNVEMDVEMTNTDTGFVMSSPTLSFRVVQDVTRDE